MSRKNYFVLFMCLCAVAPATLTAQKVTGKWYGVGAIDVAQATNDYLCELLITQDGNTVTGEFNYYFRNGYFSNKLKGTFKLDSRYLYISLLPIMYNRTVNTLTGVDCPMHGEFSLKISRTETTLSGNFLSDDLHLYTCAPLKVNFRKLAADEPTLKERIEQTAKEDTTEDAAPVPPVKQELAKPQPIQPVLIPEVIKPDTKISNDAVQKAGMRVNNFVRILDVDDDSVRIDLYDNAELDYDTVTVIYNKKLVQYKRLLEIKQPIRFYVHVDSVETNNDLIMYAENLGLIPPNSAIMILTDSGHRYEVSLTSDYQKNAAVRLRRAYKPVIRHN